MAEKKETKAVKEKKTKVKKEKPVKAPRAKKAPKTVDAEKLPKMFRKNYPAKKFEKKILKKIYIDADKKLVKGLYEKQTDEKGREIYAVDLSKAVEQKTVQRLKAVAKQIKKQKGAVKLVPLLATLIFVAVVALGFAMFKNLIVKKAIVSTMQGVFRAETNVKKVDFQLFGASLEVQGIQQTNKDNPKFNLFAIDKVSMDFKLNDLLRGKFHAEKIGVEGVSVGTEREKEGRLITKAKDKEEKKAEKKIENQKKDLATGAADKLKNMFAAYNPDTMIKEIQNDLKSPALAKSVEADVQKSVAKWQSVPEKLEKDVNTFQSDVQTIVNTDWSSIKDPASLKEALEKVNAAMSKGQSLKDSVSGTASELKADTEKYAQVSKDITASINSDKKLIDDKVSEMTHLFSKDGISEIMNDAVQSMLYDITGKYYPYISQVMDLAQNAASKASAKTDSEKTGKKAKSKKASRKRLKGTTVYYRKDTTPTLLIDEVLASGYEKGTQNLLFSANAKNITSDQDMTGKSTSLNADFKLMGRANSASAVMDSRSDSDAPFIAGNFNGKGYPVYADAQVFNLSSNSDITAMINAEKNGSFDIGGILDMKVSEMKGMTFEPASVSNVYNNALAGIKYLTLGFGIGMDADGQLKVEIKNMDKLSRQLTDPVVSALTKELSSVAAQAKEDAIKALSEQTGVAAESIKQFTDISNTVAKSQNKVEEIQKQLEAKKQEIVDSQTGAVKSAATKAASDALKNAGVDTSKTPDAEKVKDSLKGGLKGLKF